jgi:phosphotransferase system enzyme I (PtsP)
LQALLRAANGKPLTVMFPFVAQYEEYNQAKAEMDKAIERERRLGHVLPTDIKVGAMLETPSLAFAPQKFFEEVDFLSIGGNDLKQFFFAADRENERVRRRYDTLNVSFLSFIERIVERCNVTGTPLSFCGEDAGRPVEALCLAAIGLRTLSMRPASIGPVKSLLRRTNLDDVRKIIADARHRGDMNVRPAIMDYLRASA